MHSQETAGKYPISMFHLVLDHSTYSSQNRNSPNSAYNHHCTAWYNLNQLNPIRHPIWQKCTHSECMSRWSYWLEWNKYQCSIVLLRYRAHPLALCIDSYRLKAVCILSQSEFLCKFHWVDYFLVLGSNSLSSIRRYFGSYHNEEVDNRLCRLLVEMKINKLELSD